MMTVTAGDAGLRRVVTARNRKGETMRNHFSRKVGAAAAAGLLAVTLVACGGDSAETPRAVADGAADSASEGAEGSEADGVQGSADGADSGASGAQKKDTDKEKSDKGPKPTRAADAQAGGSGSGRSGSAGGSGGSGNSGGSGGAAGNLPQVDYVSPDATGTTCGTVDGVRVDAYGNATCGFAMAVAQQALVPGSWGPGVHLDHSEPAPWGSTTVTATSPATGQTYTMECALGHGSLDALCQGGNFAIVNFDNWQNGGLTHLLT